MKILKDINIIFISLQKDYANSTNSYKKLIKITNTGNLSKGTLQQSHNTGTNQQSYNETITDNINHVAIVTSMLFCTGLERKRVQTNRE